MGISYEANPKYVKAALKSMGMEECKPLSTPGAQADDKVKTDETANATLYRRVTAILNYLSQDRPDISFAVMKLTTRMANPTADGMAPLKRVLR